MSSTRKLSGLDVFLAVAGGLATTASASIAMRMAAEQWEYEWATIVPLFSAYGVTLLALVTLGRPRAQAETVPPCTPPAASAAELRRKASTLERAERGLVIWPYEGRRMFELSAAELVSAELAVEQLDLERRGEARQAIRRELMRRDREHEANRA